MSVGVALCGALLAIACTCCAQDTFALACAALGREARPAGVGTGARCRCPDARPMCVGRHCDHPRTPAHPTPPDTFSADCGEACECMARDPVYMAAHAKAAAAGFRLPHPASPALRQCKADAWDTHARCVVGTQATPTQCRWKQIVAATACVAGTEARFRGVPRVARVTPAEFRFFALLGHPLVFAPDPAAAAARRQWEDGYTYLRSRIGTERFVVRFGEYDNVRKRRRTQAMTMGEYIDLITAFDPAGGENTTRPPYLGNNRLSEDLRRRLELPDQPDVRVWPRG